MVKLLIDPNVSLHSLLPQEPDNQVKNTGSMFLWRLEEKNSIIYFLGSIHLGKKGMYPLDPQIYEAYESTNKLVVESNILTSKDNADKETNSNSYFKNETLRDYLSEDLLEDLEGLLESYGMSLDDVIKMKPWHLARTVTLLEAQDLGYNPILGIDLHFLRKAKKDGKEIIELDAGKQLIDFSKTLPIDLQIRYFERGLESHSESRQALDEVVALWKAGDIINFWEKERSIYMKNDDLTPIYNALIKKRNEAWMEKIEDMIDGGESYFVVVGAAHLVGHDSIIKKLADLGYKVTQL